MPRVEVVGSEPRLAFRERELPWAFFILIYLDGDFNVPRANRGRGGACTPAVGVAFCRAARDGITAALRVGKRHAAGRKTERRRNIGPVSKGRLAVANRAAGIGNAVGSGPDVRKMPASGSRKPRARVITRSRWSRAGKKFVATGLAATTGSRFPLGRPFSDSVVPPAGKLCVPRRRSSGVGRRAVPTALGLGWRTACRQDAVPELRVRYGPVPAAIYLERAWSRARRQGSTESSCGAEERFFVLLCGEARMVNWSSGEIQFFSL